MSGPDIAGLVGLLICAVGFVALAIAAVAIAFPVKRQDFVTPADEQAAVRQVNEHRVALPGQPEAKHPAKRANA